MFVLLCCLIVNQNFVECNVFKKLWSSLSFKGFSHIKFQVLLLDKKIILKSSGTKIHYYKLIMSVGKGFGHSDPGIACHCCLYKD